MSIYDVDWAEEFGRNKPATPRPPCKHCAERESLVDCSECGAPLCKDCVDFHFERLSSTTPAVKPSTDSME